MSPVTRPMAWAAYRSSSAAKTTSSGAIKGRLRTAECVKSERTHVSLRTPQGIYTPTRDAGDDGHELQLAHEPYFGQKNLGRKYQIF